MIAGLKYIAGIRFLAAISGINRWMCGGPFNTETASACHCAAARNVGSISFAERISKYRVCTPSGAARKLCLSHRLSISRDIGNSENGSPRKLGKNFLEKLQSLSA
jgi:hypothetical protein